jgi:hypothetical protein
MTRLFSSIRAILARDLWLGYAQVLSLFPAPSRLAGQPHRSEAEALACRWQVAEGNLIRAIDAGHTEKALPARYRLRRDAVTCTEAVAGTIVYRWTQYDYGLAAEDTEMTGVPHISVTLNADGNYPYFTVLERDLEPLP